MDVRIRFTAAGLLAGLTLLSGGAHAKATIKVGWLGAMTGPLAFFGKSAYLGASLAVDEVNARGACTKKLSVDTRCRVQPHCSVPMGVPLSCTEAPTTGALIRRAIAAFASRAGSSLAPVRGDRAPRRG
jgi:hypothetical protein